MKQKLNHEYPTHGGGRAVVHFINEDGSLVGRYRPKGETRWYPWHWYGDGTCSIHTGHKSDILLPRTVMVSVEVPRDASTVTHRVDDVGDVRIVFYSTSGAPNRIPVDDWIASLEEK